MPVNNAATPASHSIFAIMLIAISTILVASCTAGPSTRPPIVHNDQPVAPTTSSSPQPAPLPPLAEPGEPSIPWTECDDDTRAQLGLPAVPDSLPLSCGAVAAALDAPEFPRRGLIPINLLKIGNGPIPVVVVSDITGEPGSVVAARLASSLSPEFFQRFFLVGVDRRGSGLSQPVDCIPPDVRRQLLAYDTFATGVEPLMEAARRGGQQCALKLESGQQALDSWRAAGDLEEIRDQLGVERLNAIGIGEGSRVLTSYSTRFTAKVGRVVLDGLPDPSPDVAVAMDELAASAESTVDKLGADVRQSITALIDDSRSNPKILPEGITMNSALISHALLNGLGRYNGKSDIVSAISAARQGNIGPLAGFVTPLIGSLDSVPGRLDVAIATMCNDIAARLPTDQISTAAREITDKHPLFGAVAAQRLAWCSPWPVRREPVPPLSAPNSPPLLTIATAQDPVTPQAGTTRAAGQIPSAVTINWQGTGHGAMQSACVRNNVAEFLANGKIPSAGTTCPA